MSYEIFKSYKKKNFLKNLILVEASINYVYNNQNYNSGINDFLLTKDILIENNIKDIKALPDSKLIAEMFLSNFTYIYYKELNNFEEMFNKLNISFNEENELEELNGKKNEEEE